MKAKLTKSGKGWNLTFEDGKVLPFNWSNIPQNWENKDVEVIRENGQPVELKFGDEKVHKPAPAVYNVQKNDNRQYFNRNYPDSNQKMDSNKTNQNKNQMQNDNAKSPYNFVPLNETVVYPDVQEVFFDRYDNNRNTGYIDLEMENKTPIFIRGRNENFILINNIPIIPGSSLRGLIRNLVSILSYSKIEFINDTRFFFRSFADKAIRLRNDYNTEISKQTQVGILFQKVNRNFVLVPTTPYTPIKDTRFTNEYKYDSKKNRWKLYSGAMPGGSTSKQTNYEIEGRKIDDKGAIEIDWENDLIKEYKEDITRKGVNILEEVKKVKYKDIGLPVFYQSIGDQITSIGNTKNYRLPYNETVRRHLFTKQNEVLFYKDSENRDVELLDLVNLIFGKTNEKNTYERPISTRVFFEDSICLYPNYEIEYVPKILASPKPTSFQLYLEQPNGINTKKENLKTWNDSDAKIRGFKQYWHKYKEGASIEELQNVRPKVNPGTIKPLDKGNIFFGRIRFENLTDIELGALLTGIELPDGCCHKIGMCKPFGLGSILIKSKLVLLNKSKSLSKAVDENGNWISNFNETKNYKEIFSTYIINKLNLSGNNIWLCDTRMKSLKTLLSFDENILKSSNWINETRYMEIKRKNRDDGSVYTDRHGNPKPHNEFSDREVLDSPENIKNKFLK